MRRLATVARWAWLLAAIALLGVLRGTPALAQDAESVAGLIVVDGDGGVGYAMVTFDEAEISGMELLRRSGAEPVTVSFGGLGEGVCGIGRTGCAVDVCRKRVCQTGSPDSPYWQTFSTVDGATWQPLQLGASADRVRDGEVRLWAWTEAAPTTAPLTLDDISTKVGDSRNEILWEGSADVGVDDGAPPWVGVAAVGLAGGMAVVARRRTRSRAA